MGLHGRARDPIMTEDTTATPGDLTGTVREVQHQLRERYGATEAEVHADDGTTFRREPTGDPILAERDDSLSITLRWSGPDLITDHDGTRGSQLAGAVEFLTQQIKDIESDFPEADVSTFTNGKRAQLNIDLEAAAEGVPA